MRTFRLDSVLFPFVQLAAVEAYRNIPKDHGINAFRDPRNVICGTVVSETTPKAADRISVDNMTGSQPPHPPVLYSFASNGDLVSSLADFIIKAQNDAIEKKSKFSIAISGGSLPKQLAGLVNKPHPNIHWQKWYVKLCCTAYTE